MIEFRLPMKTRSLNTSFRGGWQPRAAKTKRERNAAMTKCPKWPGGPLLHVRLTRVSKGTLDFQNLAGALKSVQDGVASRLRIDDASPLVEWHYAQAKGEPEVVVQIWTAGEEAPPVPQTQAMIMDMGRERGKASMVTPPGEWTKEKVEAFNAMPIRKMSREEAESMFPTKRAPRAALDPLATMTGQRVANPRGYTPPMPNGGSRENRRGAVQLAKDVDRLVKRTHELLEPAYAPPRSKPVDAVKEAEATFAPPNHARDVLGYCICGAGPEEAC